MPGRSSWCSGSDPGRDEEPLAVSMFQTFSKCWPEAPSVPARGARLQPRCRVPSPIPRCCPKSTPRPRARCGRFPAWAELEAARRGWGAGAGMWLEGGFWGPCDTGSTGTCIQVVYLLLASRPTSVCRSVTEWAALCRRQCADFPPAIFLPLNGKNSWKRKKGSCPCWCPGEPGVRGMG